MSFTWIDAFKFFGGEGIGGWGTQRLGTHNMNVPPAALGLDFQGAQYGPPIKVMYGQNKIAGNVIFYDGFTPTPQKSSQGAKGGGGGQPTGYTYTASFLLALCEGQATSIVTAYDGTTGYTPGNGPLSGNFFATGTSGQAAWSHLSGAAALGYDRTCLYGYANYPLGSSPSLPNLNFELAGPLQFGGGVVDANPSAILNDICTDPNHGINFPYLGSLTQYSNYCVANGLFLSPIYDTQGSAQQALSDLLKYTNAEAYFSENQLKIVPRGDTAVTGNGVTFTPVTTIQYQFDSSNILTSNKGDPLVTVQRKPPSACKNLVRLSFNDRGYLYHPSSVTASIDYDILQNGARAEKDFSYTGITTGAVAKLVAQNLLQQVFYIRNVYTWKAPWRFCDLEPMDLVEVTDTDQGLVNAPVRVTSVEEDEAGVLTIIGEEYPQGIGYAVSYPVESNVGTNQDITVDPGPVSAPYLFRGPGFIVGNNNPEIWCAVTGTNPMWGGAQVYISFDGVSYHPVNSTSRRALYGYSNCAVWPGAGVVMAVGEIIFDGTNTQQVSAVTGDAKTGASAPVWNNTPGGTTTDNHVTWTNLSHTSEISWPVGAADPDVVNLPRVYLNGGQLLGGTQSDADNFATLAMVDTEVVSYENATLKSDGGYELGYLRRGAYGSTNVQHLQGAPFVRLDSSILRVPVDPSLIGKTVYFKFLSLNVFNRTPRMLSGETAYSYVVGTNVELPDVPVTPGSFAVTSIADGVHLTWTNTNPAAVGATSVERSPDNITWTVLAQAGSSSEHYDDHFTNGATWYYRIRARGPLPQSGFSAYSSVITSTGKVVPASGTLPNVIGSTATFNVTAAGWYEVALTDNANYADYRTAFNATVTVVNGATQGTSTFNVTNDSTGLKAALTLTSAANSTPITEARVRTDGANHTALDVYINWTSGTIAMQVAVAPVTGAWNGASAQAGLAATAGTVQQTLNMDPASTGASGGGTGHIGPGAKWHLLLDSGDFYHGGNHIGNGGGSGLDGVLDGGTYARVLGTALTSGSPNPALSGFTMRGNVPQTVVTGSISYNVYNTIPARANSSVYHFGDLIVVGGTNAQVCVVGGTSAGSAPSFSGVKGNTTTDGTVTWACANPTIGSWTPCFVAFSFGVAYDRADGTTSTSKNFVLVAFSTGPGLAAGTYYGYPAVNDLTAEVLFYGDATGSGGQCFMYESGVGYDTNQTAAGIFYTSRTSAGAIASASLQNQQNLVAIASNGNFSVIIPASGGSSGSGGGPTGNCWHEDQIFDTSAGPMLARDLPFGADHGLKVMTPSGWTGFDRHPAQAEHDWLEVTYQLEGGTRLTETVTHGHAFIHADGSLIPASKLKRGTLLSAAGGCFVRVCGIVEKEGTSLPVKLEMPDPHLLRCFVNGADSHNPNMKP